MNKLLAFILVVVFSNLGFTQVKDTTLANQNAWKKIVITEKFKVTKNKYKIPLGVLKQIGIDTITEITRYASKWDGGCAHRDPHIKLNWAATDKQNWIICYTSGGYSVRVYYIFISENQTLNQSISLLGRTHFKFKTFKSKFITNKLFDSGKARALY